MRIRLPAFAALVLAFLSILLAPRAAFAVGSVQLSTREPVEQDGRWTFKLTIKMGSKPDTVHVPFTFAFTQTALYERALTDKSGNTPILNRIPLVNQQPTILSMDVGFGDVSGKVFDTTKFDFFVRRDRGFEAGEYDLVIKRETDGAQIGPTQHITLKGDNPVVDRRAIVFTGDKKKDAKMMSGDKPDADADKKDNAAGDAEKKDDDAKPAGDAKADENGAGDGNAPPPVPPKQGGCGCGVVGESTNGALSALVAALAFGLVAARRRRI